MASSANPFALLFLLLLVSSFQIQARDSQFFSKFTNTNTNTNVNPNYIPKETEIPQKETTMPKQGGESGVTTETSQNGYGLYSRSNDRFPTTATNSNGESYTFSNIPETDPLAEYNDQGYDNNNDNANNNNNYGYGTKQVSLSDTRYQGNENSNYYNNNNVYKGNRQGMSDTRFQGNENSNYYNDNNNNGYKGNRQGMSDTRFQGNGEKYYNNDRYANQQSLSENGNNNYHYYNNNKNNNNNNGYQAERQDMRDNNKNGYQAERQGMSDTRFLEKGKYFYDLNNENAYLNEFQFRGMGTENKYNSGNNENSYEVDNSRDGEDENQERQQEFGP